MKHVYDSLSQPVEGTIITVMRVWTEAIKKHSSDSSDYCKVLSSAYLVTEKALQDTPNQLEILKEAGVVDAGAQGFVSFLSGVMKFIKEGSLKTIHWTPQDISQDKNGYDHAITDSEYRYCTEAIISDCKLSLTDFKKEFKAFGDSLIIAGSEEKMHLHIHTNKPDKFFYQVNKIATIEDIKVDDMQMQYQVSHNRKFPIGIITDSACDLPSEIIEKYQIQQISFGINFGNNLFLDKKTLTADKFYYLLENDSNHPVSSQPSPKSIDSIYEMMSSHYKYSFAMHISKELSGLFASAETIADKYDNIGIINSKHLSGSQGLLILRLAHEIEKGKTVAELKDLIPQWIEKTKILTASIPPKNCKHLNVR